MDVLRILFAFIAIAAVKAQDATESTTRNATTETEVLPTTPPPPKNCTTAHNLSGVCSVRMSCEYSTAAIDFTLYAPSWYKSSCHPEEVCCPFDSLVAQDPDPKVDPSLVPNRPGADNDDDDDNF